MITETDLKHLKRCMELARTALEKGDEPFGSVLVSGDGKVLREDHNQVADGDHTQHPEFNLARWAAQNMTLEERAKATVYTSGEHCPMCAAAHGWVGLGRIVYASSSKQLVQWLGELGIPPSQVKNLPIQDVIRDTVVDGPVPELAEEVRKLHQEFYARKKGNDKS
jgi:tRNA(Arg) A34 adenosine deaminase TadA